MKFYHYVNFIYNHSMSGRSCRPLLKRLIDNPIFMQRSVVRHLAKSWLHSIWGDYLTYSHWFYLQLICSIEKNITLALANLVTRFTHGYLTWYCTLLYLNWEHSLSRLLIVLTQIAVFLNSNSMIMFRVVYLKFPQIWHASAEDLSY
jgi:hypothetical protein